MLVRNLIIAGAISAFTVSCANESTESETTTDTTGVGSTNNEAVTPPTQARTAQPPEAVRTSFEAKYPQAANVSWNYHEPSVNSSIDWEWSGWPQIGSDDYYASFNANNEDYWVWYDQDGNWIGTVSEVSDHASLPKAVNNTIRSEFAGYTIEAVDKENDKNKVAYEVDLVKGEDKLTALIAENGKVMKKKGKVNDQKVKEKNNPKDSL
jgi:hypothetical protein